MILEKEDIEKAISLYLEKNNETKISLKAALIDMDGVLYDSMKNHTIAWHKMAGDLGIDSEQDEFYLYEGMTGVATINLLYRRAFNREVSADEAAELYKIKAKYFSELGEPNTIVGADRMLSILKDNEIERVLVTGSGQKSILEKLDRDYHDYFAPDKRITAFDVTYGKPAPEPYLKGLERAGCSANEAIVIENAPLGVQAGVAAGCFTIAITTGPIPRETMVASGANLVFSSMNEFADNLNRLIETFK
ncbi:MAG: HAD-IA family hydrolase [Muribaculaceae bacterium]|nr:HAD-IA family hydrolase [Muribaculaceae bacterium]